MLDRPNARNPREHHDFPSTSVGVSTCCHAARSEHTRAFQRLDITGQVFGRLTALSWEKEGGKTKWNCSCSCGGTAKVVVFKLTTGATQSCGCLLKEANRSRLLTHGGSSSPLYGTWQQMLRRCDLPTHVDYAHYGGRGIRVCERWKDFSLFIQDMGAPPFPGASIDRRNVNGDYSPDNCRWATKSEQARNKRNSRLITFRGATKHLYEWADELGVSPNTLASRLYQRNWDVEDAFTRGIRARGIRK